MAATTRASAAGCFTEGLSGSSATLSKPPDKPKTRLANELNHPLSTVTAYYYGAWVYYHRGERATAAEKATAAVALATSHDLMPWREWGLMLLAVIQADQAKGEESITQLDRVLAAARAGRWGWKEVWCLGPLVAAAGKAEQFEKGLEVLSEMFAQQTIMTFYDVELHRLKGELLMKWSAADPQQAEHSLRRAIEIARARDKKSLELQAATYLSRLLANQGRRDEAQSVLAPVYDWFTEGFDTADLKEAKALLEELS